MTSPSSPQRPPADHLYFTITDQHNTTLLNITQSFGSLYAVKYWITQLTNNPQISNNQITTTTNNLTLTIKGSYLKEAIAYKPKKEERQWTPPYPQSHTLQRIKDRLSHQPSSLTTKSSKKGKTASTKSYIDIKSLSKTANKTPQKIRQILRQNRINKPKTGWRWQKNDPTLQKIIELLNKS